MNLVSIGRSDALRKLAGIDPKERKILLVKPPYFSPWTPPLGIAILKSFLEPHGYSVRCYDFNSDPELWGMHHKYFNVLQTLEDVSINDGYSKLWWILNAHMLAFANGADPAACAKVLSSVVPLQGMRISHGVIRQLLPLVESFYGRLNALIEEFNLSEYGTVGTSTYTTSLGPSLFFLKRVREQHPDIRTIMGGGAFADDLALGSDNLETLVREYDFIDHFVLGEGEMLLLKLLQSEFAGKRLISLVDLKGVTLEMKDVPIPDFSDVGTENYYHLTIEGARSCPFQCSFCSETIQWGDYRKRPMQAFADQVSDLARRYNNNSFFMGDSLMNPYINQFAGQLLDRKANILYDGYLRADRPVANRSFVKMWADSGCYRVRLGIESAAARVLDSMDKMTTPKVISDALKTLANAGIRTTTYWITGFSGETEEDFQETCEFIREHHRYIYELEAHAYYYYPYGQIGSRLHECSSLYPDEVTDIIKFKVWEIKDADPPRVERFDRLRRVSALASELGLPNIYTMAERFAAEERWHRLHPLALEVYEGTRLHRELPSLPDEHVPVYDPLRWHGETDSVLCYQVSVADMLNKEVLKAAANEVVSHNEVLQLSLENGRYIAAGVAAAPPVTYLHAEDTAEMTHHAIERIASVIEPRAGHSFRVLAVCGKEKSELFLFAHRAVVDGPGLALLCEDLFRAYQQLLNKREVSLLPVDKTYSQLMQEMVQQYAFSSNGHYSSNGVGLQSQTITLDRQLMNRLHPEALTGSDLTPVEVMTMSVLRSLSGTDHALAITADHRAQEPLLERTVGVLTRSYELPTVTVDTGDVFTAAAWLRESLKQSNPRTESKGVLLNLEYFISEPWMGGDQWTPRGFLNPTGKFNGDLEVIPLICRGDLTITFKYRNSMERVVDSLKERLAVELDAVLNDCGRNTAAKKFWLSEYEKSVPKANIDVVEEFSEGWATTPIWIERADVSGLDANAALLSSLAIVLTRLSGRDEAVVLTSIAENVLPLKLKGAWDSTFSSFARNVSDKLSQALRNGTYALRVLDNYWTEDTMRSPVFDVALIRTEANDQHNLDKLQADFPAIAETLKLVLEIVDDAGKLSFQLRYRQLPESLIVKMGVYIRTILALAGSDPNVRLADMTFDQEQSSVAPEILAQDVFSFSAM
ncbi:MAG TPA: condensation domain-containing protein [Pyrinomonadaceae bacterium]|nr:condensation domain-containing protein [Pyrinomonadaceae bacterium]